MVVVGNEVVKSFRTEYRTLEHNILISLVFSLCWLASYLKLKYFLSEIFPTVPRTRCSVQFEH